MRNWAHGERHLDYPTPPERVDVPASVAPLFEFNCGKARGKFFTFPEALLLGKEGSYEVDALLCTHDSGAAAWGIFSVLLVLRETLHMCSHVFPKQPVQAASAPQRSSVVARWFLSIPYVTVSRHTTSVFPFFFVIQGLRGRLTPPATLARGKEECNSKRMERGQKEETHDLVRTAI